MTLPSTFGGLSQTQMTEGLKEALLSGVQQAVTLLGRNGGFLNDLQVRIPMPPQLAEVDKVLRMLGQNQLADEFVATMNHAAEQAVAEASSVFIATVQHTTIQDAVGILTGPDDAAIQYFRRTTQTNLYARFLPIVKTARECLARFRLVGGEGRGPSKKLPRANDLATQVPISAHCQLPRVWYVFKRKADMRTEKKEKTPGLQRDPEEWKTGDEPMTAAQKSYLHTLATEANEEAPENLTKAEAAKRIEELQKKTGRGQPKKLSMAKRRPRSRSPLLLTPQSS